MGREGVLSSNLKAQQTPDLRAGHKSPLGFKIEERGSDRDWYFVQGRLCVCVYSVFKRMHRAALHVYLQSCFNFTVTLLCFLAIENSECFT